MVENDPGQLALQAPPETRQARKRLETRERLYRSALRLFEQQGFDATTVKDITEGADAGKGTFFHHFPTKDHVLVAYWDEFNSRLLNTLETIKKRTTRARLLTAMEIFGKAAESEPALGRVLLGRVFTSPALIHSDQENEARLTAWLDGVLQAGVERGELRANADLESFRHLFIANLSSTLREYILFGGDEPAELMSRRTRLLLRAVENPS
jgi:AcrR family transcriptional regulator